MAVRAIVEYPDPRLREVAAAVKEFDADLAALIVDLFDTLYATQSIGLSAPQIGDRRAALVMDLSADQSAPRVFVNPELLQSGRLGFVQERCLSVPGVVGSVMRKTQVRTRAQDGSGATFECELEGMEAVCLLHEMDHLQGKLFPDRFSWFRRFRMRWQGPVAA